MLKEIDVGQSELVFSGKLDCICDKETGELSGYYKYYFGPLQWEIPYCLYDLGKKPEFWHIIAAMGLLKGEVFSKFRVLKGKFKTNMISLNFDGAIGKSRILKLANLIKEKGADNKAKLNSIRRDMKPLVLSLCKDSFSDKVERVYEKLFF